MGACVCVCVATVREKGCVTGEASRAHGDRREARWLSCVRGSVCVWGGPVGAKILCLCVLH